MPKWIKVRVITRQTYLILGHSSQTTSCVIWKRPGPSCVVLISCRQLHFLLPGASFATGLFRTTYILREETEETGKRKGECSFPRTLPDKACRSTERVWTLQYTRKEMDRDQEEKRSSPLQNSLNTPLLGLLQGPVLYHYPLEYPGRLAADFHQTWIQSHQRN